MKLVTITCDGDAFGLSHLSGPMHERAIKEPVPSDWRTFDGGNTHLCPECTQNLQRLSRYAGALSRLFEQLAKLETPPEPLSFDDDEGTRCGLGPQ